MNSSFKDKKPHSQSLGTKVMLLRKHHSISQEMLSEVIRTRRDKIVSVERGESEYTEAHVKAIKQYFDIVDLPLEEDEREAFVKRIYRWRDYMKLRSISEAKDFGKDLAQVVKLEPCDPDLVMLYRMFEVRMLAQAGDYAAADDALCLPEDVIEKASYENLYHYYYNKGYLSSYREDHEESVTFFLKALDIYESIENLLPEKDTGLYYNIARCYMYTDLPNNTLYYLLKARDVYAEEKLSILRIAIDRDIAVCRIQLNQLRNVEKILDKCLVDAKSLKDGFFIGTILHMHGFLNKQANNKEAAIDYFKKALEYHTEGSVFMYETLYYKIQCHIEIREFSKASQLLKQAKTTCANERWKANFEALGHFLIISRSITQVNQESENYIESIAIPHFFKWHSYFFALEYYRLLENHYERSRRTARASEMTKKALAIALRCFANQKGGI